VAPPAPVAACIELIKARPGTQAVLLGGHGVLAFGPDTKTTVSLLVALEEAAEAELRTAVLGRLSAPPGTLHVRRAPGAPGARRLGQGQHGQARDERGQPAGGGGPGLQAALGRGAEPRLPMAVPVRPARAGPDRHLQPRARWRTRACCWPRRAGTPRRSAAWRRPSGSTTGSGRARA
jgi:L-fuculose-phosphate aldolase